MARNLLKTLLFTALVPGTVTVVLPALWLQGPEAARGPALGHVRYAGPILLAAGAALYVWSAWWFAAFGRGTPAPLDPPSRFVDGGPYRHVRNPMYAGVVLILAGEAVFFQSAVLLVYAGCMLVLFHLAVLLYEEPWLGRRFGGAYRRYRMQVPRWFPERFWTGFAQVALLFYAGGSVAHLLNLAGALPIQEMPAAVHGGIVVLTGYGALGFMANRGRVAFAHAADLLVYSVIAAHLSLSALLHAYSFLVGANAWIGIFPEWYSYLAVGYFPGFAYFSFRLIGRLTSAVCTSRSGGEAFTL